MPRSRLLVAAAALVLAAVAAGCLASSGSGSAPASADGPAAAGAQAQDGNGTAVSGGNATDANATDGGDVTWRNQTRRGTFTGANAAFGILGTSESFTVAEGATKLVLVVEAPDAELTGSISPPCDGCDTESYETASGTYTFTRPDPSVGDWSITFFRGEGGAGTQDYVLEIHRQFGAQG